MSHAELRERDRAARERAQTEFETPIVLEAGAGTGKTATLVARVLAWSLGPGWERHAGVAEGDAAIAVRVLERTSAITFTEAAAAEMAERIAQGLGDVAAGRLPIGVDEAALPARELREPRARALLGQVDRLVVRTIHAFCRRLLAAFPLEAGVHPSFEVDADGSRSAQLVRELLETRLREAYASPGDPLYLELAAQGRGPGELEELLVRALEAGLPAEALERDPLDPARIAALLERGARALREFRTREAGRLAAVDGRSKNTRVADEALRVLEERLAGAEPTRAGLDALAAWLREELDPVARERLGGWSDGGFNKSEARALGQAQHALAAASAELRDWLDLVSALRPLRLEAARSVVGPLLTDLYAELRARGVASFGSLLLDARRLVLESPAVRARVQDETDQLLVDEFQDTDAVQCEIVRAIGLDATAALRPGLFVVGDPKQSIYGWRQADLAAYESFVSDVLAAGGRIEHLHLNFRSRPAVLAEVHELIAPVMLEQAGLQPRYQELVPYRVSHAEARAEHWVSWPAAASGERLPARAPDCAELEARALAADLLARHAAGVPWQQMAILMRSRGDLEVYLEALRAAGVPFDVEGDRSYYRRREIIDAGALVRCVIDPNDHLSLVTWLRSPSVGLPDVALVPLWLRDLPGRATDLREPHTPALDELCAQVREVAAELPAVPGLERIAGWADSVCAGLELLAALRQSFERDAPDVFVEHLRTWSLIEATEGARYLGRYRVANLEGFLRRLGDDLCETAGDPAVVLRALRRRVREAEEEEEARPKDASDDAVQVRTIHQAKGLDWEHVYLVQAHKQLPTGEEQRVCGVVDGVWEYQLFDAPTPGYPRVLERYREIARAEQVRTLYVALTRARERLVVAANWQPERPPAAPLQARSHEELLRWRARGIPDLAALFRERTDWRAPEGGPLWRFPGHEAAAAATSARAHPLAGKLATPEQVERDARVLAQLATRAGAHMVRPYRSGASSAELEPHRSRRSGTRGPGRSVAAAVGSALHQLLEHFDAGAEPRAERAHHEARLPALLEPLVEPADLEPALRRARELLSRLHDGPLLERLRGLGADVARELPLLAAPSGGETGPVGCWAGVIDLLYRDEQSGEWVVADYKTDRARSASEIAQLRERYANQGAVYTAAVQTALGLPAPPRFELWLLDAGRIEPVAPVQSAAP